MSELQCCSMSDILTPLYLCLGMACPQYGGKQIAKSKCDVLVPPLHASGFNALQACLFSLLMIAMYVVFRTGQCREQQAGKCSLVHDPAAVAVCPRWLQGCCSNAACLLQHCRCPDVMPVCTFYLQVSLHSQGSNHSPLPPARVLLYTYSAAWSLPATQNHNNLGRCLYCSVSFVL